MRLAELAPYGLISQYIRGRARSGIRRLLPRLSRRRHNSWRFGQLGQISRNRTSRGLPQQGGSTVRLGPILCGPASGAARCRCIGTRSRRGWAARAVARRLWRVSKRLHARSGESGRMGRCIAFAKHDVTNRAEPGIAPRRHEQMNPVPCVKAHTECRRFQHAIDLRESRA
jgi:hypothetical protein